MNSEDRDQLWQETRDAAYATPTGDIIRRAEKARESLAYLLGVPSTWDEIISAVRRLKVTLCGNCGKRYVGERESEKHGIGKCKYGSLADT